MITMIIDYNYDDINDDDDDDDDDDNVTVLVWHVGLCWA
jgi:hypothetical protein